jgi:PhnB protein
MTNHIPDGFHTVTAYLAVDGAAEAIAFYGKAFDAEEIMKMDGPDGKVMHAEIKIGDSIVFLSDANPAWGSHSPKHYGGSPASLCLYVADVDAAVKQAIEAGATAKDPVTDMFWGDRMGSVECPYGYKWSISTHVKDLTPEEIGAAAVAFFSQMGHEC